MIKNYIWFIKESQSFMKGIHPPIIIFFMSLCKGIGFVKQMRYCSKQFKKHGAENWYANMNRTFIIKE